MLPLSPIDIYNIATGVLLFIAYFVGFMFRAGKIGYATPDEERDEVGGSETAPLWVPEFWAYGASYCCSPPPPCVYRVIR